MSLKEVLLKLKKDRVNPKIEIIQEKLKEAASKGHSQSTFAQCFWDESVIQYLRSEGLRVEHFEDFRDGDYIKVTW